MKEHIRFAYPFGILESPCYIFLALCRQQIGALDLMVGLYNKIQRTILPVERPLIQQKLDAVEVALHRGLEELNWRADGIDGYIKESLEAVKDVDTILATIKDNVKRTQVGWFCNLKMATPRMLRPMESTLQYRCHLVNGKRDTHACL